MGRETMTATAAGTSARGATAASAVAARPGSAPAPPPQVSWWACFALAALPALLWVLASPPHSGADEPAHVVRAASVVFGQLLGQAPVDDPGAVRLVVGVPTWVADLPEPACFAAQPEVPASCPAGTLAVNGQPRDDGLVSLTTTSGRHPPAYYAVVGLPFALDLGVASLYLARAVSALLCAGFLASALRAAATTPRPRLPLLGVMAAMPPMLLHLTGVVNPNGIEAAAALALWTCLLVLVRRPVTAPDPPRPDPTLLATAGMAAVAMTVTRPVSALWLAFVVGVVALVVRRDLLGPLLRDRTARLTVFNVTIAAGASLAWLSVVGNPILVGGQPEEPPLDLRESFALSISRVWFQLEQTVGVFGWLDTRLPDGVWSAWIAAVVVLVVMGIYSRRWWRALVLAGVAAAVVLVPAVAEAIRYNDLGLVWQGRYTLPIAVGLPVLAGMVAADAHRVAVRVFEAVAVPLAGLLGGLQVVAFLYALRRYAVGVDAPLAFFESPLWRPPLPSAVLVAAYAVSQVMLVAWVLRPVVTPARTPIRAPAVPPPAPTPATGEDLTLVRGAGEDLTLVRRDAAVTQVVGPVAPVAPPMDPTGPLVLSPAEGDAAEDQAARWGPAPPAGEEPADEPPTLPPAETEPEPVPPAATGAQRDDPPDAAHEEGISAAGTPPPRLAWPPDATAEVARLTPAGEPSAPPERRSRLARLLRRT